VVLTSRATISVPLEVNSCLASVIRLIAPVKPPTAIVLTVTFQSELFSPNLISLEFNSLLYFFSFTINFGSVSSENNKTSLLSAYSTGYGPTTKAVYEKLALERLTGASNYKKNERKMSRSTVAGIYPNGAFIYPLSSAPFWASDKEQIKSLVEHPINVHENPIKTHEFSGVYFHLKECPRQGPTKLSWALPAERGHREAMPTTARVKGLNLFNKTMSAIVYKCLVPASLRDLLVSVLRHPQLMVL